MKKMIKRTLVGSAIALSVGAANAANLFIDPATATVAPGGTFNATVRGDFTSEFNQGFTDGSFSITWNPTQVNLVASGFSTETSDAFLTGAGGIVPSPLIQVSSNAVQAQINNCVLGFPTVCATITDTSGDGVIDIFDLTFEVLANTDIGLGLAIFGIGGGNTVPGVSWNSATSDGSTNNPITITSYGGAEVTVNEVPLPAAVWLFGTGLLGLAGVARRRNQAAA